MYNQLVLLLNVILIIDGFQNSNFSSIVGLQCHKNFPQIHIVNVEHTNHEKELIIIVNTQFTSGATTSFYVS